MKFELKQYSPRPLTEREHEIVAQVDDSVSKFYAPQISAAEEIHARRERVTEAARAEAESALQSNPRFIELNALFGVSVSAAEQKERLAGQDPQALLNEWNDLLEEAMEAVQASARDMQAQHPDEIAFQQSCTLVQAEFLAGQVDGFRLGVFYMMEIINKAPEKALAVITALSNTQAAIKLLGQVTTEYEAASAASAMLTTTGGCGQC